MSHVTSSPPETGPGLKKTLSSLDAYAMGFGAMIGFGWVVLVGGWLKDAGTMQPTQVSLAKWNNCRMAIDIARECRDLLGGA